MLFRDVVREMQRCLIIQISDSWRSQKEPEPYAPPMWEKVFVSDGSEARGGAGLHSGSRTIVVTCTGLLMRAVRNHNMKLIIDGSRWNSRFCFYETYGRGGFRFQSDDGGVICRYFQGVTNSIELLNTFNR